MQMINTNKLGTEEGKVFVKNVLQKGVAQITFTKVDGTERLMKCTLKEDIIPTPPADVASKSTVKRHEAQNVISVWDVEKEGWRSFRWDSIKAFSFDV